MFAFLFAAALQSANLDAPIMPTRPTIRSEIQRGRDSARSCASIDIVTDSPVYQDCIADIENQNRLRMPTGYEAFDAGLYRVARDDLRSLVKVLTQHPTGLVSITLIEAVLDVEQIGYDRARTALNLSEQDIDSALY